MRSRSIATSACTGGAPVPSTTVPPRITTSCMEGEYFGSRYPCFVPSTVPERIDSVEEVRKGLADHDYLADEGLATSIFLALRLQRPLLLEGEAGVGKTEVAKVLARWTGGELVRLQCYEGIDASQAVYEWDYSRQLLHLRAVEARGDEVVEDELYSERFLVRRPLLRAIGYEAATLGAPAPP